MGEDQKGRGQHCDCLPLSLTKEGTEEGEGERGKGVEKPAGSRGFNSSSRLLVYKASHLGLKELGFEPRILHPELPLAAEWFLVAAVHVCNCTLTIGHRIQGSCPTLQPVIVLWHLCLPQVDPEPRRDVT